MSETEHKVGSQIEGQRVPNKHLTSISEIRELIDNGKSDQAIGRVVTLLSGLETEMIGKGERFDGGIFSNTSSFEKRFRPDYEELKRITDVIKSIGHRITLTMGTFDIIHIGHARYLEQARNLGGDFLVVGVDSDEKVSKVKGPNRPIVPQDERLKMLAQLRGVDLITLKNANDPKWHLIKTICPDTLIATEGTYSDEDVLNLEKNWVEKVLVLPPQAPTSTTARLRKYQIETGSVLKKDLSEKIGQIIAGQPELLKEITTALDNSFNTHIGA